MAGVKEDFPEFLSPSYNRDLPVLLPRLDDMRYILLQMIPYDADFPLTVLDLGVGSGDVTASVLERFPNAKALCVGQSQQALDLAREPLNRFADRVTYHRADLSDYAALESFREPLHLVFSLLAFHHLPHSRKRALFAEVFAKLVLGGAFLIADEILSPSDHLHRFYLRRWSTHVEKQVKAGRLSPEGEKLWEEFLRTNIGDPAAPPHYSEHQRAGLGIQMKWLAELGYSEVDCYWKHFHWAVFGAYKTG